MAHEMCSDLAQEMAHESNSYWAQEKVYGQYNGWAQEKAHEMYSDSAQERERGVYNGLDLEMVRGVCNGLDLERVREIHGLETEKMVLASASATDIEEAGVEEKAPLPHYDHPWRLAMVFENSNPRDVPFP